MRPAEDMSPLPSDFLFAITLNHSLTSSSSFRFVRNPDETRSRRRTKNICD
jgi:hypothetical protein